MNSLVWRSRLQRLLLCVAAQIAASIGLLAPLVHAIEEVPRYRFEVGQLLRYREIDRFDFDQGEEAGKFHDRIDWTVWVARKNGDGSYRLVVRQEQISSRVDHQGKERVDPEERHFFYCDIQPDGAYAENPTHVTSGDLGKVFPRLPASTEAAKQGWDASFVRFHQDVRAKYRVVDGESSDQKFVFTETRDKSLDPIYFFRWHNKLALDVDRGLVTSARLCAYQGWGFIGEGTDEIELTEFATIDRKWMEKFADEADAYFAAAQACESDLRRIGREPQKVDDLLVAAELALTEARSRFQLPVIQRMCDDRLKTFHRWSQSYRDEAGWAAKLIGNTAPQWETTDFEGRQHKLSDYRGKVVILDFWYRGCPWCVISMPHLLELVNEFQGEDFVMLGVNIDDEEEDAQFVIEKLKLNYPTLHGEKIAEQYDVNGYPKFIVIGRDGKVRDIHSGAAPTLRNDLSTQVRALLNER